MDQILDLLCRSGAIDSKDLAALRRELSPADGEAPVDQAQRILDHLREHYTLPAEKVAAALLEGHLDPDKALRVLTPVIRVLLVEDNPADVELTRRALLRQKRFEVVGSVQDGNEALAFLRQEPPFENAKRPDILLLDLDLPRLDGFGVLDQLKADPLLESLPVIVLSGSTQHDAAEKAFRGNAVSFIHKPSSLADYRRVANQIEVYWSQVTELP